MAILFVPGQKAALGGSGAATTIVISFPAPTTAGSLLIVHGGALTTISGVTDDKSGGSNTWVKAIAEPGPNTGSSEIWYAFNAGVCQTVTVTFSASTGFRYGSISEYSGVQVASDPLDKTDSDLDAGTAAVSITTPDVTPASDGQLIFVCGRCTGVGSAIPNAPFTALSQSGQADCDGYYIQPTAAAIHGDINNTGDTHWVVQIATFKAAGAADAPPDGDFLIYQIKQSWGH